MSRGRWWSHDGVRAVDATAYGCLGAAARIICHYVGTGFFFPEDALQRIGIFIVSMSIPSASIVLV